MSSNLPITLTFDEQIYKIRNYGQSHIYMTTETSGFYIYDCATNQYNHLAGPSKSPITSLKLYQDEALFTTLKGEIFMAKPDSPNNPFMTLNCKLKR